MLALLFLVGCGESEAPATTVIVIPDDVDADEWREFVSSGWHEKYRKYGLHYENQPAPDLSRRMKFNPSESEPDETVHEPLRPDLIDPDANADLLKQMPILRQLEPSERNGLQCMLEFSQDPPIPVTASHVADTIIFQLHEPEGNIWSTIHYVDYLIHQGTSDDLPYESLRAKMRRIELGSKIEEVSNDAAIAFELLNHTKNCYWSGKTMLIDEVYFDTFVSESGLRWVGMCSVNGTILTPFCGLEPPMQPLVQMPLLASCTSSQLESLQTLLAFMKSQPDGAHYNVLFEDGHYKIGLQLQR